MKKLLIFLIIQISLVMQPLYSRYAWEKVFTHYHDIIKIFSHDNKLFVLQNLQLTGDLDALYYSTNQGLSWILLKPEFKDPDVQITDVIFTDKTTIFSGFDSYLYVFTDSNNYKRILLDTNIVFLGGIGGSYDSRISALCINDRYVYVALTASYKVPPYNRKTIYRSKDNGLTWELLNVSKEQDAPYEKLFSYNNEVIAVPFRGYLHVSTDYGDTWKETNIRVSFPVDLFNYYQGKLYKIGSFTTLDVTIDLGKTWTNIFDRNNYPWIQKDDWSFWPGYAYTVEDSIIVFSLYNDKKKTNILFISTNFGKDWLYDSIPGKDFAIYGFSIYQGFLFAYCNDRGVDPPDADFFLIRTSIYDIIKTLSVEKENTFTPFRIYPNPVDNELCLLNFSDFQASRYMIFNSAGLVVSNGFLISEHIDVSHLPAGLYNIVLISLNSTIVQKFIKN